MNVHNRFERRSLRDVLTAQGSITNELADELIASSLESHEPLGSVVVDAGHMTAWDLAKTIVTHYQMPFLPLSGFDYDPKLGTDIPASTLHQHQIVPVGHFGRVRSFAVIEPPSRDCLDALQDACGNHLFFFVSEATDVQRLLRDNVKVVDTEADTSWHAIFDDGDQSVVDGPLEE